VRIRSRVLPTMISPCSTMAPVSAGTRLPSTRDPAVLQQRQQRMLRRRVLVVHDDVAGEVTADAAFGPGAREALPQDGVAMQADLLDHHHGFHCRAPR
jgi:hypothetical protein